MACIPFSLLEATSMSSAATIRHPFGGSSPGLQERSRTSAERPVAQRRQPLADAALGVKVELGDDHAVAVGSLGEDDAPGIDDHAVAVGWLPSAAGEAVLPGRQHEALVLD